MKCFLKKILRFGILGLLISPFFSTEAWAQNCSETELRVLIQNFSKKGDEELLKETILGCGSRPIPILIKSLETEKNPNIRLGIVLTLKSFGADAQVALVPLTKIVADKTESSSIRNNAVLALANIGGESSDAISTLSQIVATANAKTELRKYAAWSINNIVSDLIKDGNNFSNLDLSQTSLILGKVAEDEITPLVVRRNALLALSTIGEYTPNAVPSLNRVLNNRSNVLALRRYAAWALKKTDIPSSQTQNTTAGLISILNDSNNALEIRRNAILVLAKIGSDAKGAVPVLSQILDKFDEDIILRRYAAWALREIGSAANEAIPSLVKVISDSTDHPIIRRNAISALGQINISSREAISALDHVIRDNNLDSETRRYAIFVVQKIGVNGLKLQQRTAIIRTLGEIIIDTKEDDSVRKNAASAITAIDLDQSGFIDENLTFVINDLSADIELRRNSIWALGNNSNSSKTISLLMQIVDNKKDDILVRHTAASTIDYIAEYSWENKNFGLVSDLRMATKIFKKNQSDLKAEHIIVLDRAVDALEAEQRSNVLQILVKNSLFIGLPICIALLIFLCLTLLHIRPLWILKFNDALEPYTDYEISILGGKIKIPFRHVLLIGFFHYHPKVLDAWVENRFNSVKEEFLKKEIVENSIDLNISNIYLDGALISEVSAKDFKEVFAKKRTCILIQEAEGNKNITFACQIVLWGMSDKHDDRLCRHKMLPVILEKESDFMLEDNKNNLIELIRGNLQNLADEQYPISEKLLENLLRKKRILIVIDNLTERSETIRNQVNPNLVNFSINALIVTSRTNSGLSNIAKTTITFPL